MGYVLNQKFSLNISGANSDGICHDGTYLWVGASGTIYVYAVNSNSFSLVDSIVLSGVIRSMAWDGTYMHVVSATGGEEVAAFQVVNGEITKIGASYNYSNARSAVCDNQGYIWVGGVGTGARIISFNGSTYSLRYTISSNWYTYGIAYNGTFVYFLYQPSGGGPYVVVAYSFNGSVLTTSGSTYSPGVETADGLSHDGTYIVLATMTNLRILSHDPGVSITQAGILAHTDTNRRWRTICVDGYFIYGMAVDYGIRVWRRSGTSLSEVSFLADEVLGHNYQYGHFRAPYLYTCTGTSIAANKMDLTAQFTADKLVGIAPLTVNFTAV